jgi:hypothetical protein
MLTNPHIAKLFVEAHIDDLRRVAREASSARPAANGASRRRRGRVVLLGVRLRRSPKRALAEASEPCT